MVIVRVGSGGGGGIVFSRLVNAFLRAYNFVQVKSNLIASYDRCLTDLPGIPRCRVPSAVPETCLDTPRLQSQSSYRDCCTVSPMGEPAERDSDKDTSQQTSSSENDFLSNILAPGSSLNPIFLLVVDGVLALLALTLLSLIIATGGNVHLIALLFIELALWVSIKW